jgi:predicted CXXCH cytochrome family protein
MLAPCPAARAVPQASPAQVLVPVPPNPHLDPGIIPVGCAGCHEGHGIARSPMLPASQSRVCLDCHGLPEDADRAVARGKLTMAIRPTFLSQTLSRPYTHRIDARAATSFEPGVVTCTSCHSPHRSSVTAGSGQPATAPNGERKLSTKSPDQLEYELCETCHGNSGVTTQNLNDVSRLFYPTNRSYHPVHAPAISSSPSLIPGLAGRSVNCTDCHGSDDASGPRGPHGSSVRHILKIAYSTADGGVESEGSYALCYSCHVRRAVLEGAPSSLHAKHCVEVKASCATCHSAHGSVKNRALIRFGEETTVSGTLPSASGKLAFVSTGPGSGSCFLTCHGKNHDPLSYGLDSARPALLGPSSSGARPTGTGAFPVLSPGGVRRPADPGPGPKRRP